MREAGDDALVCNSHVEVSKPVATCLVFVWQLAREAAVVDGGGCPVCHWVSSEHYLWAGVIVSCCIRCQKMRLRRCRAPRLENVLCMQMMSA